MQVKKIDRWINLTTIPFVAVAISYPYLCLEWLLPVAFLDPELWLQDDWVHPEATIAFSTRLVFFVMWLLPLCAGLYAIVAGASWLFLLRKGNYNDSRVARSLWHLGVALVLNVAASIFAGSLSPMVRSWHNPDGPLPLRLWYQTELGGLLVCGMAFMLISIIQLESIRLAEEASKHRIVDNLSD